MKKLVVLLFCIFIVMPLFSNGQQEGGDGEKQMTIVHLTPSQDILYWQWVKYGVEETAKKLGVKVVTYNSHNSASEQAANAQTAITVGAKGIVLSPVSSTSCPTVLDAAEEAGLPVTFAAIGPESHVTNYACLVTSDDLTSGYEGGLFLARKAKALGGTEIGVLSLPLDRTNAQNKLEGLKKACEEEGVEIVQLLQTHGLTINEAVQQANDMLTAHPNIKGLYGMYEQAGIGAVRVLQTRGLTGKVAIVSSDGSPESIGYVREGLIDGIVVQEAVGQGVTATQMVYDAIMGKEVTKDIPLPEPLVTTDNIDDPEIQEVLRLVYPPSAGAY